MTTSTIDRRIAKEITISLPKGEKVMIDEATVSLMLGLDGDIGRGQLSYDRKAKVIEKAVKKVDAEGGDIERLHQIALYAIFVFDLPAKELTFFIPRLGKWKSYRDYCVQQARKRRELNRM